MSDLMKAVRFHGPKDLKYEHVPRPTGPGKGEVKVRVEAAGICGSDLHVYETGAYVTQIPVIMGHEFAGTVLEVGEGVLGLSPGDHVVGDSRVSCGECDFCSEGYPNLCRRIGFLGEVREGAFAEEIVMGESALVQIEPMVPFQVAALAEPLAVALHAFRQAGVSGNPKTLILGAGPMGALVHAICLIRGLTEVFVTDVSEYRRRVLNQTHPGSVIDPQEPYDLVFETTASAAVVQDLLPKVMNKKATLVMIGLFGDPAAFNFNYLVENEWTVRGCAAFSTELAEAAQTLESHWPKFEHVVSHHLPLVDYQKAFDTLLSPEKMAMKIIFQPRKKSENSNYE
jgi:2-desacetyl-2-hydroxyethyl bacteriochlorophyllide A dehydrogenase